MRYFPEQVSVQSHKTLNSEVKIQHAKLVTTTAYEKMPLYQEVQHQKA